MPTRLLLFGALACLLAGAPARADEGPPGDDDIPVVGRPAGFSFASGDFKVEARA